MQILQSLRKGDEQSVKPSITFLVVLAFCCTFSAQTETREFRELKMADQAILSSLVVSHSTEGRQLCRLNMLACFGPAKEEIAIALIGARRTKTFRHALVKLLAYNLDGALGEDFNCYVLNSGPLIKDELLSVDSSKLVDSCHHNV